MERAKENLQGIKQERKAADKNNERAREKAKRLTSGDKEAGNQVSSGAHQLVSLEDISTSNTTQNGQVVIKNENIIYTHICIYICV